MAAPLYNEIIEYEDGTPATQVLHRAPFLNRAAHKTVDNSVICNLPPPEPADQGRLHLPGVGGQPGVRHEEEDGHQGQTDGCSTVLLTLHPPFPGVHRPRQHAHLHLLHEAPQVVDDQDQEAHLHPQAHVKE